VKFLKYTVQIQGIFIILKHLRGILGISLIKPFDLMSSFDGRIEIANF
jgi:hypothetical protein